MISQILDYKNMGQEAWWLDCAEKLTAMIQNIVEFAKLIPGNPESKDQVRILLLSHFTIFIFLCAHVLPLH